MFIFPKKLGDDALEDALKEVREEIEKAGGEVTGMTRLGKRPFARPLKKQDSGHYAVIGFTIDGAQIAPLHARFALKDSVLRVQFVKAGAEGGEMQADEESGEEQS
jgi:ribosomal protein S6